MKAAVLAFLLLAVSWTALAAPPAPLEIAGVRLGDDIKHYAGKYDSDHATVDLTNRYLTMVTLSPVPGFRSGYVTYGNCDHQGRIARIKMNYLDESKEFYEKILLALKKRYGDPQEWRGNPFGTLRIWKWSLKDPALGDISLILEHYSGSDDSFTRGNSIRISAPGLIEEEGECYKTSHPEHGRKSANILHKPEEFEALLPR